MFSQLSVSPRGSSLRTETPMEGDPPPEGTWDQTGGRSPTGVRRP